MAGEFAVCGEEFSEGLGVGRVQCDGQGGAELVDPVPGEAVRGRSPPQVGARHHRILPAVGSGGRGGCGRDVLATLT
ncbi:hypothetical protein ACFY0G_39715 [Streptomyces sp. NPDC001552]|uniref:hypothetical protein n=1 Tax=Streptomyces sp. NPDC001552 TaxID=3364587 RepID=UPI0036CBEC1E